MTDRGRSGEQATVRERRSDPRVDRPSDRVTDPDAPPTVRMKTGEARPAEPAWPGQTHARGTLLGRYVVLSLLGAGGMGEVYAAYDPALDRRIALKVLRPVSDEGSLSNARAWLLGEAQALARLAHPNVVSVYDVGTLEDDVYIAMEFVEGITLNAWLASSRTPDEIVAMFVDAGRGLEAAHAAGIVHRDFKPDNVIIGKDGRVRVIDFGIALVQKPGTKDGEEGLVGTPAFMAPEQFEKGTIGPAADQFSFAVSLYAALWKQHAFAGESDFAMRENVLEGRLTPPPESSAVPGAVRDAVVRALSRDPAARHPSMSAVLDALQPRPRRSVLPLVAGLIGAVAIAGVVLAIALQGRDAPEPCTGFERDLGGVWDPARKAAVQSQVGARAWPGVQRVFDAYAADWVGQKVAACRATSVTREQTPAVLERRMACLDSRRRELDAAIAIVAAGGAPSGRAIEIGGGLRSLAGCANLAALAPAPDVPRADIVAIEDALARARAQRLGGNYEEARAQADAVVAHAERIRWTSAVARSLVERGLAESSDGDPTSARATLFEAVLRAEEAGDEASGAAAWVALVAVEGAGLRRPSEALRWARHADVALAKAGGDQEQQGQLLHNIAAAMRPLDRHAESLDHEQRALALFVHAFGERHVRVANQRSSVATSLRTVGKLDDAVREAEAALALLEELVGDRHPYVASTLNNLALIYEELGRLDEARRALERAIAIREAELGPSHASLANPLMNLTSLERRAGRFDQAEALWQRAFDIRVASLGANHADVTRALHGKLLDRMNRSRDAEARALVDEVITRQRARPDAVELSGALSQRCELQRRAGKLELAANACSEALAALGATPDPNRAVYVHAYAARVAAQRGQASEAAAHIERARTALHGVTRDRAVATGYVGWAAAHVALAAGRHDEAVQTARDARASLLSHGLNFTYVVDDLEKIR